jgi:hypothetical protein
MKSPRRSRHCVTDIDGGSFVALVQFGRSPSGSIYVPAHIEDGKFVPQTYR